MKKAAILVVAVALAGCETYMKEPITGNPKMQAVNVEGQRLMVAPYSDGTWGATSSETTFAFQPNPAIAVARLTRAIETVSGCRVTSTHYEPKPDNLIAVVDCKK